MSGAGGILKPRWRRRGFALVEITVSLSILVVLGLLLLKLSLNVVAPRQWMMRQTLADAFMTSERAAAEKIPFEELEESLWPESIPEGGDVEIGKLPGLDGQGMAMRGTLKRMQIAEQGGEDDADANPAGMKIWRLQSTLSYEISGRRYEKTRTVIRMQ